MRKHTVVFIDGAYIDGAYLNLIAKELSNGKPLKYDISKLAENLAGEQGLICDLTFYYTAPPYVSRLQTRDEVRRRAKYDRFIFNLKQYPDLAIREGRCQKTGDGYIQKGVDTQLAVDLAMAPIERKVDDLILIACDTDFAPVLERIRKTLEVRIILYYYTDRARRSKFSMSNHILSACDKHVILKKEHFEKALLIK
jgi:uncharacterized LabA/DUF88 family protein